MDNQAMLKDRAAFAFLLICSLAITPACAEAEEASAAPATELAPFVRGAHLFPVYGNRIKALREQMDLAIGKGWISSDQSSSLRNELSRLDSMEAKLTRNSSRAETDEIDKAITKFNADLQEAMKGVSSPAPPASAAPLEPATAVPATPMSAPQAQPLHLPSGKDQHARDAARKSPGSAKALSGASAQSLLKTIKPKSK